LLTQQVRKYTADLSNAQSELASEKARANKLDKQQAGLKARLREIEDIAEASKDNESNVSRTKKAMEDKLEEMGETLKDLEAEKKALENRLNAAKNDSDEANRLFEEAEAAAKRWESEAKNRAQDISDMEAELELERDSGRKMKNQLNAKISELTVQLELGGGLGRGASPAEWKEMTEELTRVRRELSDARDSKIAAEKALTSITTERDDYKMQFEKVESSLSKLRIENRKLQNDLDEVKDSGSTAQAARELLQKTNQEYLTELNTLKRDLAGAIAGGGRSGFDQAALTRDNAKLKEDLTSLDRKFRLAEIDLRDLKPQLDDLRFQLDQEKVNNAKLNSNLREKEKMLMERELANAKLIQNITDTHSHEKGTLSQEAQELKVKNEDLTTKFNRLEEDYNELFKKLDRKKK